MDALPRELVEDILERCIDHGDKNSVLPLRLVCRLFDRILKPTLVHTLGLDFSRLSREVDQHPRAVDLQTIGTHCKSLYIDLMVVRDDAEVEFLTDLFQLVPTMTEFCQALSRKYSMNQNTFTESDYFLICEAILFNCRQIERLRLNLPVQLVGRHCQVSTRILANTLKALAERPEEGSSDLETLVIENLTDIGTFNLWMNPKDVMNIIEVLRTLKHLVLTLRRHETDPQRVSAYGTCLWNLLSHADSLSTLALIGSNADEYPPRDLRTTRVYQMDIDEWRARSLPALNEHNAMENLTCLELKRMELSPEVLIGIVRNHGATLEELYLSELYLKVEQDSSLNNDGTQVLWIGLPNQRPPLDGRWVAMELRRGAPQLRICRASFLSYDRYLRDDIRTPPEFDFVDPCGLNRSLTCRFVEVVTGVRQPNTPNGDVVEYLPRDSQHDYLCNNLSERTDALQAVDYDVNAYHENVKNTTSCWLATIDGIFPNANSSTLDELHYMADTACRGMNEMQRRRSEPTGNRQLDFDYGI